MESHSPNSSDDPEWEDVVETPASDSDTSEDDEDLEFYDLDEEEEEEQEQESHHDLQDQRASHPPPTPPRIFTHLFLRESSPFAWAAPRRQQSLLTQFLPSSVPSRVWKFNAKPYCAQFSYDGSLFYAATQDFNIHLYNPLLDFSKIATIKAHPGRWTITDCDLSKDSRSLFYSSIHDTIFYVNLSPFVDSANDAFGCSTMDSSSPATHIPLSLGDDCGVWSIRVSDDGRELVAGATDGLIYVYDIEYKRVLHRVSGHRDDVNAVTFADTSSNLLLSGSDDTTLRLWDRRSSLVSNSPAGILTGHTEGITFLTTRGRDGRTVVSNAKDQTMKVWDLRNLLTMASAREVLRVDYGTGYDYRWQPYPKARARPSHPRDVSVATYTGHSVLRTLIRCHYSPESTGYRYLYSGSADGNVCIWDPEKQPNGGEAIKVLSTPRVTPNAELTTEEEEAILRRFAPTEGALTAQDRAYFLRLLRQRQRQASGREVCVRDVSWNPGAPQIVASLWKGEEGGLESFEF
ncbi:DDB1- and CUL4-associated factor 11 [Podochytrium sp. JEL0797]|nr:DDB1- and CUL4-associated factor 11 [Podochytrium sp. JEL0797]